MIEGWEEKGTLESFLISHQIIGRWRHGCSYSPYLKTKLIPIIQGYKFYIAHGLQTTAGKIYYKQRCIGLHPIYFANAYSYQEDFINTVFHEISHACAYAATGEAGHGPSWQHIFANFGFIPTRCHENGKAFLDFKDAEVNNIADELGDLF